MKFTLNMYEMMELLDPLHRDAYDKLQSALEQKICKTIPEGEWLRLWDSGEWEIEMVINIKEQGDRNYKDGGFVNATEERKFNEDMEGK